MTDTKIGVSAVIGFLLELCALFALGYFGFTQFGFPFSVVIGIGLPLAAAVLWGLFRAPRRTFPTPFWVRIAVEAVVMSAAVAALALSQLPVIALVFAGTALVTGVVNDRAEYRSETQQETTS
jgi:inner membrane protein involved in colicin E2 resistance